MSLKIVSVCSGKVILHPDLDGAPLLILANKQDKQVQIREVDTLTLHSLSTLPSLQDALPVTEVESAFNTGVESIGDRDCKIQRVSALKG